MSDDKIKVAPVVEDMTVISFADARARKLNKTGAVRRAMSVGKPRTDKEEFILKVQRPIAGGGIDEWLLVYNKDRRFQTTLPQLPEIMKLFRPLQFKLYIRAVYDYRTKTMDIKETVEDQPW